MMLAMVGLTFVKELAYFYREHTGFTQRLFQFTMAYYYACLALSWAAALLVTAARLVRLHRAPTQRAFPGGSCSSGCSPARP
jgi:8-oxo-dGTP pyrophosphatase MutT (NUDIX family)